ncbi:MULTISPECIES: tyrosine-type recombinase/integrase [Citrobacter]|uniref:tyrosine-type recombinase/integrase n=1 Tax=Citrobacter TaxID=544 RepID=UPI002243C9C1|nr:MULTISPECIES: site-specific integrase [Citrobacter]MCW8353477.1 site-specific integrase [Citrobacter portucalensis]MCX9053493.1 site-specific integrase [Citrobacter portucalensis]MDV0786194.1 site-specific integrase [Citrobacter amalonaticus]MEB0642257.1 site-specific integrase [Citrobacter amalonaticus]
MAGGTNKLSDASLRKMLGRESPGDSFYADGDGLSVKVSRAGILTWYFTFRIGGRESASQRIKLGNYPDLSLKAAREKREQCRSWLAEGKNPKHQLNVTTQETLKPVTVKEAMDYWIREYAIHKRANVDKHTEQLKKHIFPYIGDYPLSMCETRHWLECFARVRNEAPVAAGYLLQMCKQALKFCRVHRYAVSNVLDDLTIDDVGRKQNKRDREHTRQELVDIWLECSGKRFKPYYSSLLRLLVVFGCRTQELRLSRVTEWDLKDWIWTVPKEHSKGGEKILRPIPEAIRPFIAGLIEQHKDSGLLLGEVKKPEAVSQWGRGVYKRLGHSEPWTLHDLRRTFSTTLNNMGIAPHVVEQLLGHTLGGVMAVYNRSQYLPEKLDALNKWMERLELLNESHENIILMKVAR